MRSAASTTVLSSRWLDLWKQIPDLEYDRISRLPDRIISAILSFLPLKQVAATSVLSSRWSNSWKHTPSLDFKFGCCTIRRPRGYVCKNVEMVNLILQSHRALSLKLFRIFSCVHETTKWTVTKWLEFVFLREVESLELSILCWGDRDDRVVLGESLREISTISGDPRTLIFFQSLKSLHLEHMKVGGEDIELFLCNCPLLKRLMIHLVILMSDIEVCSSSLKHLVISGTGTGYLDEISIKISAPNLTFISIHGSVSKLLFENVPRLVKAAIGMDHFASAAYCHISQLRILDIRFMTLEIHSYLEGPTAYMQEATSVDRSPHQHLKVFSLTFYNREQVGSDHVIELAIMS